MSTTTVTIARAGIWSLDPIHSRVDFEVSYLAGTFKGEFHEIGAERHPGLRFDAENIRLDGDGRVSVDGELTIKGVTKPVAVTGTVTAPIADYTGNDRIGLNLTAAVDRTEFGGSPAASAAARTTRICCAPRPRSPVRKSSSSSSRALRGSRPTTRTTTC